MLDVIISTLREDLVGILLSGAFIGFAAKIFHRSFIKGFFAGVLPRIALPLIYPYVAIIPLPFLFWITLALLYTFFIWILCRLTIKQSLTIAIVAVIVLQFGVLYLKQTLTFMVLR